MFDLLLAAVLTWTAPPTLANGSPAHDIQTQRIFKLQGQYPYYYRGIELTTTQWFDLVYWCQPVLVGQVNNKMPGDTCSYSISVPGQYIVLARNSKGDAYGWSKILIIP